MSARIFDVIKKILSHPDSIVEITKRSNEYYFRFKSHVMSLVHVEQDGDWRYVLYIYPGNYDDVKDLADDLDRASADEIPMKHYSSVDYDEFGKKPFRNLYHCLESMHLNMDSVFDDILADD